MGKTTLTMGEVWVFKLKNKGGDMRHALAMTQEIICQVAQLNDDEIDFFSNFIRDVSHDLRRIHHNDADDERTIMADRIRRSLRWWHNVGHDRHYSQKCISQLERALSVIEQENPGQSDLELKSVFIKMEALLQTLRQLDEYEIEFVSSYLQDLSHKIRHFDENNEHNLNLVNLWDEFHADSFLDFTYKLLSWTYHGDDYGIVSDVCSWLYGSLPETQEIKNILIKGIWNIQKSNRLRERFFWCFNHHFKESARHFFATEIGRFIYDNERNEELVADIIDLMHWNLSIHEEIGYLKSVVNTYLENHPDVINRLHSSASKKLLGIQEQ